MATDKTAVTCYLDDDSLEYLTKYCTKYNITGKNKNKEIVPRLGTGLSKLLSIISTIPLSDLPSISPNNIPSQNIETLIENKLSDRNLLSKILGKILSDFTMVSQLRDAILSDEFNDHDDSSLPDDIPVKYFDDDNIDNDKGEDDDSNLPNDLPVKYPDNDDKNDSNLRSETPVENLENDNKDDSNLRSKIPVKYLEDAQRDSKLPDKIPVKYSNNDNKDDSKLPDNVPVKYLEDNQEKSNLPNNVPVKYLEDNQENSKLPDETSVKYFDDTNKDNTSTILSTILLESQSKQTVDNSDAVLSKEEIDSLIEKIKVSDFEVKRRKKLNNQTRWAEVPINIDKIPNDIVFSNTQLAKLIGASSSSTISTWKRHNKQGNQEKIPQWFRDNFEFVSEGIMKKC